MITTLSNGKQVDPLHPACFLDLTKEEYAEFIELCRKRNEEKAA
jgi:hypothetical protein